MNSQAYNTRSKPSLAKCVFVLGCDRSGTTLLQNILNSHPDLLITYEMRIVGKLSSLFYKKGLHATWRRIRNIRKDFDSIDFDSVYNEYKHVQNAEYSDFIAILYNALLKQQNRQIWGDKTPIYTDCVEQLSKSFPNAKFIHIIRDPRSVVKSWEKTNWGPSTTYHCAKAWRARVGKAEDDLAKLNNERFITIKFEDFLSDTAETTKAICDKLGIQFTELMLKQDQRNKSPLPGKKFEGLHKNIRSDINTSHIDTWQDQPHRKILHIENICFDHMSKHGYDPVCSSGVHEPPLYWKIYYFIQNSLRRKINSHKRRTQKRQHKSAVHSLSRLAHR